MSQANVRADAIDRAEKKLREVTKGLAPSSIADESTNQTIIREDITPADSASAAPVQFAVGVPCPLAESSEIRGHIDNSETGQVAAWRARVFSQPDDVFPAGTPASDSRVAPPTSETDKPTVAMLALTKPSELVASDRRSGSLPQPEAAAGANVHRSVIEPMASVVLSAPSEATPTASMPTWGMGGSVHGTVVSALPINDALVGGVRPTLVVNARFVHEGVAPEEDG